MRPDPVLNQPPELGPFDAYATDPALVEAVQRYEAAWVAPRARDLGREVGAPETAHLASLANHHPPELHTHDRFGHRIDEVRFHPSYHQLMALGKRHAVHSLDWQQAGTPGAVVARSALMYVFSQAEAGVQCPITMTHAAIPALREAPELASMWEPPLLSPVHEPALQPILHKQGATLGMAMTEKQGGSDVRANQTRAVPSDDGAVRLYGHKWFCSAPMSDGFLTLAQGPEGLSCYLVPRVLEDGSRNPFAIQRLKNKLGNKSNASSEIEYRDTWAWPVGVSGRGIPTILAMVEQTRLDISLSSAAMMRQVVRWAVHHATHRAAFGRALIAHPLMQNVLADLAVEVEAAVALAFRIAHAYDHRETDEDAAAFARIATPVGKYWLSKQIVGVTFEALECHGGNGYVEDWPLARLYREAPLGSVWEGSGNVQCLDVLRALHKTPGAKEALLAELRAGRGADPRLDRAVAIVQTELDGPAETAELRARRLTEQIARTLQASLLVRHGPAVVAEAFVAGRLASPGTQYGTLPTHLDFHGILERAAV